MDVFNDFVNVFVQTKYVGVELVHRINYRL